jgi:Leucine-rich repeat (LRR) protein
MKKVKFSDTPKIEDISDTPDIYDVSDIPDIQDMPEKEKKKYKNMYYPLCVQILKKYRINFADEYHHSHSHDIHDVPGQVIDACLQLIDDPYAELTPIERKAIREYKDEFARLRDKNYSSRINLAKMVRWLDQLSLKSTIDILQNIKKLNLNNYGLTEIPDAIGSLSNLQYLYLNYNNLTVLPDTIGQLKLKELHAGFNKLKKIPKLNESIVELHLYYNQITSIKSLCNLINLKNLYVYYNKIKTMPSCIMNLNNLETIDLTGNPIIIN